ncbi:MAG: peptidoglycan DD-metalloendopeptidase family protein [Bacteroidota bacterium]
MSDAHFRATLKTLSSTIYPVLGPSYNRSDYCHLNLSIDNNELQSVNVANVTELGGYVHSVILRNSAKVAYGGYLEKRDIYQRSEYFNQSNPETERNIHLGLDLWIKAETSIYAPLDGMLHSFNNNTNFGDYGPCLILEHDIEGVSFFTLYGHLSLESLRGKEVGQIISKGDEIATLGTPEVNGSYPAHLHFQIIIDLQDHFGDYPGVSNTKEIEFYKENCPDPNLLLGM